MSVIQLGLFGIAISLSVMSSQAEEFLETPTITYLQAPSRDQIDHCHFDQAHRHDHCYIQNEIHACDLVMPPSPVVVYVQPMTHAIHPHNRYVSRGTDAVYFTRLEFGNRGYSTYFHNTRRHSASHSSGRRHSKFDRPHHRESRARHSANAKPYHQGYDSAKQDEAEGPTRWHQRGKSDQDATPNAFDKVDIDIDTYDVADVETNVERSVETDGDIGADVDTDATSPATSNRRRRGHDEQFQSRRQGKERQRHGSQHRDP